MADGEAASSSYSWFHRSPESYDVHPLTLRRQRPAGGSLRFRHRESCRESRPILAGGCFSGADMEIKATLKPGARGMPQLLAQYGEQLVCVRYRYDPKRRLRFKTVELIVDTRPYVPENSAAFFETVAVRNRLPGRGASLPGQGRRRPLGPRAESLVDAVQPGFGDGPGKADPAEEEATADRLKAGISRNKFLHIETL